LGLALFASTGTSGCALLVAGGAAGAAAGGAADVQAHGEHDHGAMTYVGTVVANIPYFPAKVLFAGLGAATSGAAYVLTVGLNEPSNAIWDAAVKGNYVLTPAMIEGRQSVHFVGTAETETDAPRSRR